MHSDIEINQTNMVACFGLLNKKIRLDSITSCECVKATPRLYTGMGVRYGGGGSPRVPNNSR
jgi:hypothetical protein